MEYIYIDFYYSPKNFRTMREKMLMISKKTKSINHHESDHLTSMNLKKNAAIICWKA